MSERKVLNKYYPPDYDPSKVPRVKRKNKQNDVRLAAPFNMRCSTCGNYIACGTKFNAKKETVEDKTYHKLLIFRFYIKCPRCMASIIFRTDPKDIGYEVELGATENFKALKDAEQKAREQAEAEQEEEKIDPMKQLENRTKASRDHMEASERLQQIRSHKHKIHSVDLDSVIDAKRQELAQETAPALIAAVASSAGDKISDEAKRLFREGIMRAETTTAGTSSGSLGSFASSLNKSTKRPSSSTLSSLHKKITLKPKTPSSSKNDKT